MAIPTINLTDPISTLVTVVNSISSGLGDPDQLTGGDSNAVAAINAISTSLLTLVDSDKVYPLARQSISVEDSDALGLTLSYEPATGLITLAGGADAATVRSYLVGGTGLDYDSATGVYSISDNAVTEAKMADDAVSSAELKDVVTLIIYNSAGNPVKTLYGAGS